MTPHKNWRYEDGKDYKRDDESATDFRKKQIRKYYINEIIKFGSVLLVLLALALIFIVY